MPKAPKLNPDEIAEHIENMSRRPFREVLARIVESAPSPEAIQALAERSPDRWGQLYALAARAAGFNEKLEVEGSITHKIQDLSDSELEAQLAALRAQLDTQSSDRASERRVDTSRLLGS